MKMKLNISFLEERPSDVVIRGVFGTHSNILDGKSLLRKQLTAERH